MRKVDFQFQCKAIRKLAAVLLALCVLVLSGGRGLAEGKEKSHPLEPALKMARSSQESLEDIKDYRANFIKKERVDGRIQTQIMHMKFREDPFSVYLRFYRPHEGREVLYVDGRNNGKLLAHEAGFKSLAGTVALLPTSPQAMGKNRHPITRIGMANMLDGVIDQWKKELKYGEIDVKYYPNAKLGKRECKVIETSHPKPRRQFEFHMTRLFIEKESNLPVRVEQYGFPSRRGQEPPLIEEYTYSNIKTNNGFTDRDFHPENPDYDF